MRRFIHPFIVFMLVCIGAASVMLPRLMDAAATPPYPPSQTITSLTWDSNLLHLGNGRTGDNWPITWADDDLLYTAYGDGAGFSNSDTRYSLGFATVAGDPPTHIGQDFRSDADTPVGEGPNGIKASGLLLEAFLATGDTPFGAAFATSASQSIASAPASFDIGSTGTTPVDLTLDDIRLDTASMPPPSSAAE